MGIILTKWYDTLEYSNIISICDNDVCAHLILYMINVTKLQTTFLEEKNSGLITFTFDLTTSTETPSTKKYNYNDMVIVENIISKNSDSCYDTLILTIVHKFKKINNLNINNNVISMEFVNNFELEINEPTAPIEPYIKN